MRSYLIGRQEPLPSPHGHPHLSGAIELYDRHIYEKGACVYHMIRTELGDELFWQAIHTFVQQYAHQTVETMDLLRAIEESHRAQPAVSVRSVRAAGRPPRLQSGLQWDGDSNWPSSPSPKPRPKRGTSSKSGLFDLRIPIGFGYVDGKDQVTVQPLTVRIHEQEQALYFPLKKKPDFISFDVGNHYTKTVKLEYPVAELKAQLQHDPDPLSRIFAAEAIAQKGGLEAVKALAQALTTDPFWGVRAEVAEQLAKLKLDQATDALLAGLADAHPKVRRAVVTRSGWNEMVRSSALAGVSQFKTSEAALAVIFPYTEPTQPDPLRWGAMRALGTLASGQSKADVQRIVERLEAIAHEPQFRTQMSAIGALGLMAAPAAATVLRNLADHINDGRLRRRAEEALKAVQKRLDKDVAVQTLQQDFEELKKTNQDLKSRLADLEAKMKKP
jgi:aminopeptidase N